MGVSEGEDVSVRVTVEVAMPVSVEAGAAGVFVDAARVSVGNRVNVGIGVDGELQAKRVKINRLARKSFWLIASTIHHFHGFSNKNILEFGTLVEGVEKEKPSE